MSENEIFGGLKIFIPKVFEDYRGHFFESYNSNSFDPEFNEKEKIRFVQDNQSFSKYGVIRGIHIQLSPFSQSKLVRVLEGKILDVAIDLRKNSETFGRYFTLELSSENKKQLFIPNGFGHGFSVLSQTATVIYKCDQFYNKDSECGIIFNDQDLKIDWKIPEKDQIIGEKDLKNITFKEFKKLIDR